MRVTTLPLPRYSVDTYIITGDWHSHYCCEDTVEKLLAMGRKKPTTLVINGDFLDAEPLMLKNLGKYLVSCNTIEESLLPLVEAELEWGKNMLDRLKKVFKKIVFVAGNHEIRYDNKQIPSAYRHNFDYRKLFSGMVFVEYNDWLEIGKTRITHGCYHGMSHLKKHHALSPAFNTIVGHLHRHEILAMANIDGVTKSISLPCMRSIDAGYLKNAPTNWSRGFIIMNVDKSGDPHFCCLENKNGEMILPCGTKL